MTSPSPLLEMLREPSVAEQEISDYLSHGHLALMLGAGVSAGLGLPEWGALVRACEDVTGLDLGPERDNALGFMARMDAVRLTLGDTEQYHGLVREQLYGPDLIAAGTYDESIASSPMLSALGALAMASARGSVGDIYTMNFDDALDWYLHLHGLRTQVVADLPTLHDGLADVRLHHFHGFLPLNPIYARSEDIVLTEQELVSRLAEDPSRPWPATMGAMLLSKVLLIVGTSMGDLDVKQIFERVRPQLAGTRPLGFALGAQIPELTVKGLLERSVVPVSFGSVEEIPGFLLRICQRAAASWAR